MPIFSYNYQISIKINVSDFNWRVERLCEQMELVRTHVIVDT